MYRYEQSDDTGRERKRRRGEGGVVRRHPILANIAIIIMVAALGLVIAYLSLALFTRHGQTDVVPRVVNSSYTQAVESLHDVGFRSEIRDSVYYDYVKPGMVVEQFPAPGAVVKPGRKIFLTINAVHPKEVMIDGTGDSRQPAMRGLSLRQAKTQLEELGFKNIKVIYVLGDTDRVLSLTADGKMVYKLQKVPLTASIVLKVYDGRKRALTDSLQNAEMNRDLDEQLQEMEEGVYNEAPISNEPTGTEPTGTEPAPEPEAGQLE